jgi:O-succinylbenzoic acid--CoA ligase
MNALVTVLGLDAPREKWGTAGKVVKYREVRVTPDGEIQVRGATRFAGYVEGEKVVQPFDADGWYSTGDLGSIDADGYLTVQGRRDNQFISGGENIQPENIERVLLAVPGVVEAVVVPVPSAEYGARSVAFVRMASGDAPDAAMLGDAVMQVRPRYEAPVAFYPWPLDASGEGIKISRKEFEGLAALQQG